MLFLDCFKVGRDLVPKITLFYTLKYKYFINHGLTTTPTKLGYWWDHDSWRVAWYDRRWSSLLRYDWKYNRVAQRYFSQVAWTRSWTHAQEKPSWSDPEVLGSILCVPEKETLTCDNGPCFSRKMHFSVDGSVAVCVACGDGDVTGWDFT